VPETLMPNPSLLPFYLLPKEGKAPIRNIVTHPCIFNILFYIYMVN
jgi:hypothetical protein